MSTIEPAPAPDRPPAAPLAVEGAGPSAPASPPRRLWALAIVAGVLAGVMAWLAGEATLTYYVPPTQKVAMMGGTRDIPSIEDQATADRKNATLANGILGAALGLALGAAGGLARGSLRGAGLAAVAGLVLGAVGGAGGSAVVLPVYYRQQALHGTDLEGDIVVPLLVHVGAWAAVGAAGGAALGFGLGDKRRLAAAVLGGLIGGALGAGLYEVAGALVFAGDKTTQPVAEHWAPRLMAALLVSVLSAALATFAATSPARRARANPVP